MTHNSMDATTMMQAIAGNSTAATQNLEMAIERLNTLNPQLNAATEIMADEARGQLSALPGGPLKGLPISVKECYAIAGKQITSGSQRMKPINCSEDATVVKRLRAAGAVIVARGNTSEFLLGRETDNLVCGTTQNALASGITAGGSSGGDAALTAAGCVAFGVGTDIGGSCRYPALFNGIVGFKPASGQIDKGGIFPSSGNTFVETMNSPGVLCRSVRDARMVYNVIAQKRLEASEDVHRARILTCSNFRVKITDTSIAQALRAATGYFKAGGYKVQDIDIPESGSHYVDFSVLMGAGFTDKIYEWSVTATGERLSFLGELARRMRGRKTLSDELFAMLLPFNFIKPSATKLAKVISRTEAAREKYRQVFGNDGVLVMPTAGILAPAHRKFYPQYNKPGVIEIITPVSFCNIYNLSCITLPAWKFRRDEHINPPGIQLVTAAGNEELLLNVAERLEREI